MFSDLLNRKPRWPKRGDRLLRSSKNWDSDVTFSRDSGTRDAHIWNGYVRAGAILAEQINVPKEDFLYPILYCYRHGLEVAMKWILNNYGRYADLEQYERNHNLLDLWKACKDVIAKLGDVDDPETIEAIEVVGSIVREFHNLDPESFAFRYSTDKKGTGTIKLPDDPIDLSNVKDVMEGVNSFFEGMDGVLDRNSDC